MSEVDSDLADALGMKKPYGALINDVEEGGETEFLHQHVRFTPKRGTVVFWPAAFTHQHRGNPPLKGTKYILTGWYINCPTA